MKGQPWNVSEKIIGRLLKDFKLNIMGDHGWHHWLRVREIGLALAEKTGANKNIVELFALFHDCRRENEYSDPGHGYRGGNAVIDHCASAITYEDGLALIEACRLHTHVASHPNITIQTCFDADRLDLGRVGIKVDPKRLCTDAAKEPDMLEWASNLWSTNGK